MRSQTQSNLRQTVSLSTHYYPKSLFFSLDKITSTIITLAWKTWDSSAELIPLQELQTSQTILLLKTWIGTTRGPGELIILTKRKHSFLRTLSHSMIRSIGTSDFLILPLSHRTPTSKDGRAEWTTNLKRNLWNQCSLSVQNCGLGG